MDLSLVVLVGGRSTRLGQDKVFVEIGGEPLVRRVIGRLRPVVDAIVLVAAEPVADPVAHYGLDLPVVADRYPGRGSLGGLWTGLAAVPTEYAFVMAVDMPFINPNLVRFLGDAATGSDVVIPIVNDLPQPTHAVYSRRCLDPIEERLRADQLRMIGFHDAVRVRRIDEATVRTIDPDLRSFFNLNRPADLEAARRIAAAEAKPAGSA